MRHSDEIRVTFEPSGRSVYVLPGTLILEAAIRAGMVIQTPCGGKGSCGKCRVRIVDGRCREEPCCHALPKNLLEQGYRLACQCRIEGETVIEVPKESLFGARQKILTGDTGTRADLNPMIRKAAFKLVPPSEKDPRSDQARFLDAVGNIIIPYDYLRKLSSFLRANSWCGTAVLSGDMLIGLEPPCMPSAYHGVAVDVGTTTVVGTLLDLADGSELAVASSLNGQVPYGDDVVTRIKRIRENPVSLAHLQQHVLDTINGIITELCLTAGVERTSIYEVTIAGNSTMQQILCGLDPSSLGEMPFVQAFNRALSLPAFQIGVEIAQGADVYVFPQIESFVGGDTVAGMLATRIDKWEKPVLLVDIGTNGEIVLSDSGRMTAASTAAGPAFEGARISQGMRATNGAIEKVVIAEDVAINVIGDVPPIGLCGTALIDTAAEMLRIGILDATGRILPAAEAPAGLPNAVQKRLVTRDGETEFVLAEADPDAGAESVRLTQRDIRELQLATAAIRAGINILLRRAKLAPGDLGAVLLAGAFGNFIRRNNACRIGLLPDIPHEKIQFIGNASSLGAKLALLSVEERKYAEDLAARCKHVDLSQNPDFQEEFSAAMLFPE